LRRTSDFFGPSKPASIEKVKAWMGGKKAKAPSFAHGQTRELAFDMDDKRRGTLAATAAI
jgi:hypothetical protein